MLKGFCSRKFKMFFVYTFSQLHHASSQLHELAVNFKLDKLRIELNKNKWFEFLSEQQIEQTFIIFYWIFWKYCKQALNIIILNHYKMNNSCPCCIWTSSEHIFISYYIGISTWHAAFHGYYLFTGYLLHMLVVYPIKWQQTCLNFGTKPIK